jgi:hypothetical protein
MFPFEVVIWMCVMSNLKVRGLPCPTIVIFSMFINFNHVSILVNFKSLVFSVFKSFIFQIMLCWKAILLRKHVL